MDIIVSISLFLFGVLTWFPFINNIYGHDVAANLYRAGRAKIGEMPLYKDSKSGPIGHYVHLFLVLFFWKKENMKALYSFMCVYCSISAVFLYWLLLQFSYRPCAVAGSILFSLYIVSPRLDGNWGVWEQLTPLPLFLSLLCIFGMSDYHSYTMLFVSGVFFGYAILVKQVTAVYLPGFMLIIFGIENSILYQFTFIAGILFINLIPLIYYSLRYNLFWDYLISFGLYMLPAAVNPKKYNKYYPKDQVRGEKDIEKIKKAIFTNSRSMVPLIFFCILGIVFALTNRFSIIHVGILLCLFFSIWPIFMRRTFFPHYWLNTIPWLSIFAGIGLGNFIMSYIVNPLNIVSLAGLLAILMVTTDAVFADKRYYVFSKDPYQFLRKIWGEAIVDRYKSAIRVGKYIRDTTAPSDKILVCGWAPHILLYSERSHFTPESCMYTEMYFDIYNRQNPTAFDFLNSIYKFKNFTLVKQRENVFQSGYPEVIVFAEGFINIAGFEQLTGIQYSLDDKIRDYHVYRADLELTELMGIYRGNQSTTFITDRQLNIDPDAVAGLLKNHKFDEAFDLTKTLLKSRPFDTDNLLKIGDLLIRLDKSKLMFHFFTRLIENNFVYDSVKFALLVKVSEYFCYQNKWDDAKKMLQQVIQCDPRNVSALNNLGVIHYKQNKRVDASECFRKALSIDPNNLDALSNLDALG